MNITGDGVEIEDAHSLEVLGEWLKFVDNDGVVIKIAPEIVRQLMAFTLDHLQEFDEETWDDNLPPLR